MKAKDFLKLIENREVIKGIYLVPAQYICAGFVTGTHTLKVWGYYPYIIEKISFTSSGKIKIHCRLINKLGTSYEHNDFLTSGEIFKFDFNKNLEFYHTEEEAIHECHLRNRGKKGPGPCHNYNMEETLKTNPKYVADKFY